MTAGNEQIVAVRMPQVNVNDEEVRLVGWRVDEGGPVVAGQPLVEVETSKSIEEVPATATGVVRHVLRAGDQVKVGVVFAYIGPSAEAIDAHLAVVGRSAPEPSGPGPTEFDITAGAMTLVQRYGIDPRQIPAQGRIRREDVERFAREMGLSPCEEDMEFSTGGLEAVDADESVPAALRERVGPPRELSDHQRAVAQHLARTRARTVPAHVAMDVPMERVAAWVDARRKAGAMTGPLPLIIRAAGGALQTHPNLASFRIGRQIYPYRSIDIAYTARDRDGRLFTPVIREVGRRSADDLLEEIGRLNMAMFRGQLRGNDLAGGCMTISLLDDRPVLFHIGLLNSYQSALLTIGAVRQQVVWSEGHPAPQVTATMVLSYDHGIIDGWEASAFLDHIRKSLSELDPA